MDLFITRYKLDIENKGMTPAYESRGAKMHIDVTLTAGLSVGVNNWMVIQDYNGSDHNTIQFETHKEFEELPQKWNWKEANWDIFQNELNKQQINLPHLITQKKCDEALVKYYKAINNAMKKAIPRMKGRLVDRNNP